jgi:hypothetical protein
VDRSENATGDDAEMNAEQTDSARTQSRTQAKSSGPAGVREAARKDSKIKFTAFSSSCS